MQRVVRLILATVLTTLLLHVTAAHMQDDTCTVSAASDVNKRIGPGTNFDIAGTLSAGESAAVHYQTTDANGFVWWQLQDDTWVRSDMVSEKGNCASIPSLATVFPSPTPLPSSNSGVQSGFSNLTITNNSPVMICYVVMIPRRAEETGDGWGINEVRLAEGITITAAVQPDVYSVAFLDCRGEFLDTIPDIDLTDVEKSVTVTYPCDVATEVQQLDVDQLISQGIELFYAGNYAEALAYFQQALAIQRESGDRVGESITLSYIGAAYGAQSRYAEALDCFQQALVIQRELGDRAGEGIVLNNIGLVHYYQGRYAEALDHYQQALDIAREVGDRAGEGIAFSNIAEVYVAQGQYAKALEYVKQALDIQREVGNRAGEGAALGIFGMVYEAQGQYAEALDHYQQALAIQREVGDRAGEGGTLSNIGAVYGAQGRYAEALDHFQQALEIKREVGDRAGEGRNLGNIGAVYDAQDRYAEALGHFQQALEIFREVGDRRDEGITLGNIGAVYDAQGRYAEALDYYEQALGIQRELGNQREESATLNNIGAVYDTQGHYAEALDYYQQALEIQRAVGDRAGESTTLNNIGAVYEELGQRDAAIQAYQDAVEVIEQVTNDAALNEAIAALSTQPQSNLPYQQLAVLLAQQGELAAALDYTERGRAVLARTDLSTGNIDFREGLDADLLALETDLRLSLDSAQQYLDSLRRDTSATQGVVVAAQSALDTARNSYEQHLSVMQLQGGYLSREISRDVASLAELQAALPSDSTLLLYSLGNLNSVAFIITADGLDAVVLDVGQEQVGDVNALFVVDRRANANALRDLYDLVFAPIADKITTSRLIIVPDGALNYVPFAALQAPDGSYLIDDYSVSMVSSATTLVLLHDRAQQTQTKSTSPALVLAQSAAPGLPTLRNAPLEALDVADLLGVEPNLNATEADLRTQATGSQVLYITTHTELDRFAPLFSVIHLGEGGDYDGRLEVREIYELDLSQGTELVVLNGCETASGGEGEDFGLLTRAFFAAGTPRVVASLWRVDDAATADLMTAFIAERANYDNEADALRAAMLATREKYPEPYYWASFVLSGLP